jgi:LPXTG-motif cell wall-anchored protein
LDDTKYWFCFCDNATSSCETCSQVIGDTNAFRIPFDRSGKVDAVNQFMNYDLPATGGSGIYPLMLVSVVFIITPLVYVFIQRRKRERRSTG